MTTCWEVPKRLKRARLRGGDQHYDQELAVALIGELPQPNFGVEESAVSAVNNMMTRMEGVLSLELDCGASQNPPFER